MMHQLPLGIRLKPGVSFDNFIVGDNAEAIANLIKGIEGIGDPFIFLWGETDTGKTHLLQASCQKADSLDQAAVYIPLRQHSELAPEVLSGLEQMDLVCLDDIEEISGDPLWEQALFNLFNGLRSNGKRLLVSADRGPLNLGLALPDLASRLTWGLSYRLQTLSEGDKRQALITAAEGRGLQLPEETALYLLRRAPRNMGALLQLLEHLDQASLAAQRRLTIPFVRSQLEIKNGSLKGD
ncbi:DnaA regulatory inactivator Hda [Pseudomonadota bacterium]